jgi:hypothetical protein
MGSEERKGTRSEGVDSWRELCCRLASCTSEACCQVDSPQDNATILGSPSGVLPCTSTQIGIDCASLPPIRADSHASDPCVDYETGAGFECIWLTVGPDRVEGVEQGGCRELSGWLSRSRDIGMGRINRQTATRTRHGDCGG